MGRAVLDVPPGYRAGGWQVGLHIASGSWGSVYAAHRAQAPRTDADPPEGTEAALKLIPRGTLSWPQYAQLEETVREEVRFNDQADHPLLVHTFETFVVDDRATPTLHGAVVVAMERAERNLAEAIGDLQPDEAARIVAQMCAALTYRTCCSCTTGPCAWPTSGLPVSWRGPTRTRRGWAPRTSCRPSGGASGSPSTGSGHARPPTSGRLGLPSTSS